MAFPLMRSGEASATWLSDSPEEATLSRADFEQLSKGRLRDILMADYADQTELLVAFASEGGTVNGNWVNTIDAPLPYPYRGASPFMVMYADAGQAYVNVAGWEVYPTPSGPHTRQTFTLSLSHSARK